MLELQRDLEVELPHRYAAWLHHEKPRPVQQQPVPEQIEASPRGLQQNRYSRLYPGLGTSAGDYLVGVAPVTLTP